MNLKNFCIVEVSTGYDDSATSIVLKTGDGSKLPSILSGEFHLVWFNATDYASPHLDPNREIIKVTNVVGDVLTIERPSSGNNYLNEGSENTAKDHNIVGKQYKLLLAVTKSSLDELDSEKLAIANKSTGAEIDTGTDNDKYVTPKAIADSKVSFIDEVETLTNKTIDLDNNIILNAGNILVGENLLDNSNFINNSTNGYGRNTPDGNKDCFWLSPNALSVQGGFPTFTKQQALDTLGIADSELEGLWNLNEASGDAVDLSSNNLTLTNSSFPVSQDYLMENSRKSTIDNQYLYTNSIHNLLPATSLLWGLNFRYGQLNKDGELMGLDNEIINTEIHYLKVAGNKVVFSLNGLSTSLTSDIILEQGKSYHIVAGYASNTLYLWINGILKTASVTGSINNTGITRFTIGAGVSARSQYGTYQNVFITSAFRGSNYIKNLFYNCGYKGIKTRRDTGISPLDGTEYIDLSPQDVMRLRGKSLTLCADVYSLIAGTSFIQIVDLPNLSGTTTESTVINSYERLSVTHTVSANATTIRIVIGTTTSNTSSWFENLMLVEGSTKVNFWNASQNDWQRFPRLMRMDPPADLNGGYHFEEDRWYHYPVIDSGVINPITNMAKYLFNGKKAEYQIVDYYATSNNTVHNLTLPFNSADYSFIGQPGNIITTQGAVKNLAFSTLGSNNNILNVSADLQFNPWTNSGIMGLHGAISVAID